MIERSCHVSVSKQSAHRFRVGGNCRGHSWRGARTEFQKNDVIKQECLFSQGVPIYLNYTSAAQKNKELWSLKSRVVLCFSISTPRIKKEVIHVEIASYDLLILVHNRGLLSLIPGFI